MLNLGRATECPENVARHAKHVLHDARTHQYIWKSGRECRFGGRRRLQKLLWPMQGWRAATKDLVRASAVDEGNKSEPKELHRTPTGQGDFQGAVNANPASIGGESPSWENIKASTPSRQQRRSPRAIDDHAHNSDSLITASHRPGMLRNTRRLGSEQWPALVGIRSFCPIRQHRRIITTILPIVAWSR